MLPRASSNLALNTWRDGSSTGGISFGAAFVNRSSSSNFFTQALFHALLYFVVFHRSQFQPFRLSSFLLPALSCAYWPWFRTACQSDIHLLLETKSQTDLRKGRRWKLVQEIFLFIFCGSGSEVLMGSGESPLWRIFSCASFISLLHYWKPGYCY